ncbi:MAG TPA: GNAT family protein [Pseudolysinimonas sp.]|nr:GNAT family protein [Pseudolysinimonas sp.]
MSAVRPEPAVLTGRFVRLEPLREEHLPGLFGALHHPLVFAGGYGGGPAGLPRDREAFDAWAVRYGVGPDNIRFVVRVLGGPHDGEVVGASTLGDLDEDREHAHIGWTGYDPRVWGTQVNPECKLLMLGLAFSRGYGRVKLQADERNARSRGAIEKLGASFEGITRRDLRRADGSWRDTAVYSILIDEWPDVKRRLERRLAEYGDRPVLFRTPPA